MTAIAGLLALAPAVHGLTLAPDAPARYVVQAGDTLWSLAGRYLSDPWSWPDLWHTGQGIDDPNRIFPGDVLVLSLNADGRPQLRREEPEAAPDGGTVRWSPGVRASALPAALPVLPPNLATAFMGHPTLLPADALKDLPYVLGFEHERLAGALGNRAYVRGLTPDAAGPFSVVHVGDAITDPTTGRRLGYQATFTATAVVERRAANPREASVVTLDTSARETLPGDRLVPAGQDAMPGEVRPHVPTARLEARIAAVLDGVAAIGPYDVVVLNRGRREGLEVGHVLTLWHAPGSLRDPGAGDPDRDDGLAARLRGSVRLPPEPAGTVLVFRTYADASYGLVLNTRSELRVGDSARTP